MARGSRYRGKPRTDLERFVSELGLTVSEAACEIGVSQPTFSRLLSGEIGNPSALTFQKVTAWAERVARAKRIPRSKRLAWTVEDRAA